MARCATGLAEHDVVEGDRVALHLPNSVDFVVTALSCLWIGAIFVPLAMTDPEARLATLFDRTVASSDMIVERIQTVLLLSLIHI